jgi:hypothetical protein
MGQTITSTKVEGIDEIKKALGQLPGRVEKKVIRQSQRAGLKPMLARARELAPKGETGNLRKAVKLRTGKRRRKNLAIMNVQVINKEANKKAADGHYAKGRVDEFYAPMVEFGHDIVRGGDKDSGGTVVGYYPGSHFLEKAFGQTAQGTNTTTCKLILDGIEQEVVALRSQTKR